MATDYPLIDKPTITLSQFQNILVSAKSPAAGQAPAMYAAIRAHGVDPGVVLAVMQHESNFGKAGIAVGRNNGFGSRYYPGMSAFGATDAGGWASFPTWSAGAAYTASLLASSSYAGSSKYDTAATFPKRYAPSSDGNNPSAYGAAIVNAINTWTGTSGGTPAATKAKTAKHAPKPAPAVTLHAPQPVISAQAPAPTPAPMTTVAPVTAQLHMSTGTALGIVGLIGILALVIITR